jgi:N-acetylglucosamine-6-phosphate deacetylase
MKFIKNVRLYDKTTDIGIENGKIAFIGKTDECGKDFGGLKIYPGLIDVHSHGCMGYDTMDEEDHLSEMARFQLSHGTTTWYPTTMTMSREDIIKATSRNTEIEGGANIPGFHMEGPFINPLRKGAQNERFIFRPSMELFNECKNIKMVTIAPELPGSRKFIEECPAIVSLGHSDADYETAKGAFAAGVRCLTHTFNAMNGIHHREPGPIGAAAENGEVYAQLITDGKHVHPSVVKMLINIFGDERIIIISDSIRATGIDDGEYSFGGQKITVTNRTALTENGALAGSTSTLFDCVRSLISFGIEEERAVKMATENPARLMGLDKGQIKVGMDADFILVDDSFNLIHSIARGEF